MAPGTTHLDGKAACRSTNEFSTGCLWRGHGCARLCNPGLGVKVMCPVEAWILAGLPIALAILLVAFFRPFSRRMDEWRQATPVGRFHARLFTRRLDYVGGALLAVAMLLLGTLVIVVYC